MSSSGEALPPVLERMLALWNGADLDPGEVYADRCLENGETVFGPDDVRNDVRALRGAMPNLRFMVDRWFRGGDRYVLLMRAEGTHRGSLSTAIGTVPATGRTLSMRGIEMFEVQDDRIVDVWVGWDWGTAYAALGATVTPDLSS